MTELGKLAQWHDEQASQKDCTGWLYDHHTAAAATIRAALAKGERLAAAEAERDAAVARTEAAIAWNGITPELEKISIRSEAFAEGERRATAAIVAWLRDASDPMAEALGAALWADVEPTAAAIERLRTAIAAQAKGQDA